MSPDLIELVAFLVLFIGILWSYETLMKRFVEKKFGVTIKISRTGGRDGRSHTAWNIIGAKDQKQFLLIHVLHILGGFLSFGVIALLLLSLDRYLKG